MAGCDNNSATLTLSHEENDAKFDERIQVSIDDQRTADSDVSCQCVR